jgi:RNA 2',3'-cyclic 3'-phosphodiesterase
MHRLFVAIRPPETVRARLLASMGGVGGARWQSDDQLHLTLRFIGEVDRHRADDVHAALGMVIHPPFESALAGVGSFDRRGEPTALWAGVAPQEPLRILHKKVDQALVRAGLEPERRAYTPHITLARLPRGARPVGGFLEAAGRLASPLFRVEDFCLYESHLTPEGARYEIVERYSLA